MVKIADILASCGISHFSGTDVGHALSVPNVNVTISFITMINTIRLSETGKNRVKINPKVKSAASSAVRASLVMVQVIIRR